MEKKARSSSRRKTPPGGLAPSHLPGISPPDRREIGRSRTVAISLHADSYVDKWVRKALLAPTLMTKTISLLEMQKWHLTTDNAEVRHDSGRFFSLTGLHVRHRTLEGELVWDQPIIDQPEVGILGIIAKKIRGVLHFCIQAKEEPGNIGSVQLSPTVQATFSNYTMVHGGTTPLFVDYFLNPAKGRIMFAKLQTEDGGRFLYKSNRNMIVQIADEELTTLPENFIWLTLRQIRKLLQEDNLVHACTRSILSALIFPAPGLLYEIGKPDCIDSLGGIIQWLDDQKAANHFLVKRVGLNVLKDWSMDRDGSFSHEEGRFFRVLGIRATSSGREVHCWDQPILDNPGTGIIGFLIKISNGERYYLVQAKAEPGNRSLVQIGPTVQFTPSNYVGNSKLAKPFLYDEFCCPDKLELLHESRQSEEGARFYQESHVHRILALPEETELLHPAGFRWMSESALHFFISMGESVNSCARSALSLMSFKETRQ